MPDVVTFAPGEGFARLQIPETVSGGRIPVGSQCGRFREPLLKLVRWSLRNIPGFSLPASCSVTGVGGEVCLEPEAWVRVFRIRAWDGPSASPSDKSFLSQASGASFHLGIIPAQALTVVMGLK